jgi:HAD superfamily hydrolase (TIGR01509 family)
VLTAVLFDLDDTLFDHTACARDALAAVHRSLDAFRAASFEAFARAHAAHLEALHLEVLAGALPIDAARIERFRRLLVAQGGDATAAADAARLYRAEYVRARRAVRGAPALLAELRRTAAIAVVSNNLLAEQREKIEQCGLAAHIDALVVSEEAGVSKPDPEIFRMALDRVGARPEEAVMIGDSWAADIAGARAAGLAAIWFNPRGLTPPEGMPAVPELRALEPVARALRVIFASHTGRADRD